MRDADGRSTLYVLALENRLAMARFLLEEGGADIESRDSEVGLGFMILWELSES
jgi:ankyrin repeat protein